MLLYYVRHFSFLIPNLSLAMFLKCFLSFGGSEPRVSCKRVSLYNKTCNPLYLKKMK